MPSLPEQWPAAHQNISYIPVLSEPAENDQWHGRTGLVHQAVTVDHENLADFQVYACGSPGMIEATKRDFIAAGLPEDEFFADIFSFSTN